MTAQKILENWRQDRVFSSPLEDGDFLKNEMERATVTERNQMFVLSLPVLQSSTVGAIRWETMCFLEVLFRAGISPSKEDFLLFLFLALGDGYQWVLEGLKRCLNHLEKAEYKELKNYARKTLPLFLEKDREEFKTFGGIKRRNALGKERLQLLEELQKGLRKIEKETKEKIKIIGTHLEKKLPREERERLLETKSVLEDQLKRKFNLHFPELREKIAVLERTMRPLKKLERHIRIIPTVLQLL